MPTRIPVTPSTSAALVTSERDRHVAGGTSGRELLRSIAAKLARITAEVASSSSVRPDPQPCSVVPSSAVTSRTSPATTASPPATSSAPRSVSALDAGRMTAARAPATTPTGTLTRKTHSQLSQVVSMPPRRTPAAAPPLPIAPHAARAVARWPPEYVVAMIDSAAGVRSAAPSPWTARATMRPSGELASPLASDAAVKTNSPVREASREQHVDGDDPLQVAVVEAQRRVDRRERDVHHGDVEDDHELRDAQQDERGPGPTIVALHQCKTTRVTWVDTHVNPEPLETRARGAR